MHSATRFPSAAPLRSLPCTSTVLVGSCLATDKKFYLSSIGIRLGRKALDYCGKYRYTLHLTSIPRRAALFIVCMPFLDIASSSFNISIPKGDLDAHGSG